MASTLIIGPEQQGLEGRTVRDIAEHDPAQVNEVWCRKIFRQLLQSLELQYAMQMPHRAITPDTVVFHDNGEPLLLPSNVVVAGAQQDEAADLTALAGVVHFAITRELVPGAPLRGRGLDDYSDSLLTAVDRCMSADPAERPRTIGELRNILGIVSLGPAVPAGVALPGAVPLPGDSHTDAQADAKGSARMRTSGTPAAAAAADVQPSFMREPGGVRRAAGLSRWQRWAVGAGGGAVLLAIALALFAELRDSGSYEHIVLTLPQPGERARSDAASVPPPLAQADAPPAAAGPSAAPARAPVPAYPAPEAQVQATAPQPSAPATPSLAARGPAPAAASQPANAPLPAAARPVPAAGAPARSATYRLQIQPWGIVYVDGVDRGVSPPVKRLVLTPGRHTIRIANPNFHDRVLEVDTSAGNGQIGVDFSDEPR